MRTYNHRVLVKLRDWTRKVLPDLNNAVEAGRLDSTAFLQYTHPKLAGAVEALSPAIHTLSKNEARSWLQVLGILVASAERHHQAAGQKAGEAVTLVPGLGSTLIRLGRVAQQPPRDNHSTYWLWNDGDEPLTFTGDSQEIFFRNAVIMTEKLNQETLQALRSVTLGLVSPVGVEAREAYITATENFLRLRDLYASFLRKDPVTGAVPMTPEFFATRFRTYLVTYPLGDITWKGPNAGNLGSQISLDYVVGTVAEDYDTVVERRMSYLPSEDQDAVTADMDRKSCFEHILEAVDLDQATLARAYASGVVESAIAAYPKAVPSLVAFAEMVSALGRFSSTHYGLIVNFLVKFARTLPAEVVRMMPVRPDAGTGGMPHDETRRITEMRRNHPVVGAFVKIVLTVDTVQAG